MKVFVSVIDEEAELAAVLKRWIEDAFLGQVSVFVSSVDMTSGQQWFRRLEQELTDPQVLLVICSPDSVSMPWINFETGACHSQKIPVIPICHSGMTPETLPIPLLFFQGLEAQANEFGVRVIGDLAKHLGFDRSPPIRYDDMTTQVKEALSHIGRASEKTDQEEMGSLDHIVSMTDKMETLTGFISEFGEHTNEIAVHTQAFGNQSRNVGNTSNPGTTRYLQRISREFGIHLDTYAGHLEDLNQKYGEVLPEVGSSLQHVVTLQPPQTTEDWDEINQLIDALDLSEKSMSDWKRAVVETRGTIDGLPNIQRDMRRAARKTVAQFDILIQNLDATLDMIYRVRSTMQRLVQSQET